MRREPDRPANRMSFASMGEVKDGTLTASSPGRGRHVELSFKLAATVNVTVDGKAGKLAHLPKGTLVRSSK